MKNLVTLRAFSPADIGMVIDLLQDVSTFRPQTEQLSELALVFQQQQESHACVAVVGEQVVGFGTLFVLNRVRGGRSGIIEDMVVAASKRGHGIGRMILENLLAEARARGCFKVSLESSVSGQSFYQAMGFELGGQIMKYRL